jgi:hypothetical protein
LLNEISKGINELLELSHFLKSSTFQEEVEYRLCHFPRMAKNIWEKKGNENIIGKLEHRYSNKKIIPFHRLNFSLYKSCIKEVVLGPRCMLDEFSLKSLTRENGFKVNIKKSLASYR